MKNALSLLMLVLLLLVVGILPLAMARAGYDHIDRPATQQDIIDALMPVPTVTAKQYGSTDKTRLVYNISELLKVCRSYEMRISELEKQVAALEVNQLIPERVDEIPKTQNTKGD